MTSLHHLRLLFLALAALLAAALAWGLMRDEGGARHAGSRPAGSQLAGSRPAALPTPRPPSSPSLEGFARERALLAQWLTQAPEYADFARKYATTWPIDWTGFIDKNVRATMTGTPSANPDAAFAEALRDLRRSRGIVAAKAAPEALTRIYDAQAATIAALSVLDKRLCVDFLFGQSSKAFVEFSERHRPLVARMADAAIDAIIDGGTSRVARSAPGDADFEALEAGLRASGLKKEEIEALLDGKHPDPPLPDERLCSAGMAYLEVLKRLPEETRMRIYAFAVEVMSRM